MDDLEHRIRLANPNTVRRGDPLSDRAKRELSLLLKTQPLPVAPTLGKHRRRSIVIASIAAILVVITVVVTSTLLVPRPAAAAPPLLTLTPLTGGSNAVLEGLASHARKSLIVGTSQRIVAETWSADLTISADEVLTYVQPREIVRIRDADLGGDVVTYAGPVRWGVVPAGQHVPAPGDKLDRQAYSPGEYPLLFTSQPPKDSAKLLAYFGSVLGTGTATSTGEYFRAVADLRNEWVLDGAQTAAIINFLRTLPGVKVAGEVTDRLGREGVAIATESRSDGAFRDLLIFGLSSGRLLSSEQIYLGGLPDVHLPATTVLDYIAWKESA